MARKTAGNGFKELLGHFATLAGFAGEKTEARRATQYASEMAQRARRFPPQAKDIIAMRHSAERAAWLAMRKLDELAALPDAAAKGYTREAHTKACEAYELTRTDNKQHGFATIETSPAFVAKYAERNKAYSRQGILARYVRKST